MVRYRIHRIKEIPGENFRWAAHTGGAAIVKSKDYDLDREVEAHTLYGAWKTLLTQGQPLRPGDLLEICPADGTLGQLHIAKYIGFEPASWYTPEKRPVSATNTGPGSEPPDTDSQLDPV